MEQFDQRYDTKVKAAYLYYAKDMAKGEIAKALSISRPTLSKLLKEARDEGIVKIQLQDPKRLMEALELEECLREKYGLKEARVALCQGDEPVLGPIGRLAGEYLSQTIQSHMKVGVAWGRTLQMTAAYMGGRKPAGEVEFIPLLGGPKYSKNCAVFANSISERLAACYENSTVSYLYAPLLAKNQEDAEAILATDAVQEVFGKMERLDFAIVGIDGGPLHSTSVDAMDLDGRALAEKGAVGNICSRFFDIDGNQCILDIDQRVIAIGRETLKKTPLRAGVAGGAQKAESIRSALKAGLVNVLVTDEFTARSLV